LREEVVRGKTSLHAVALDAVGIQLENRRSPWRAVALAVALEILRVLFHVHPRGQEMLVHEAHHAFIRPHLGIQPSTAASHRGGAEVEEHRFLLGLRVLQHLVNVTAKLDWHRMLAADVTSLEDNQAHGSPAPASKDRGSMRARRAPTGPSAEPGLESRGGDAAPANGVVSVALRRVDASPGGGTARARGPPHANQVRDPYRGVTSVSARSARRPRRATSSAHAAVPRPTAR